MGGLLAVIVIGIIIIVIAVAAGQQRNNKLISEGKLIKRDISFVETSVTFTLKDADTVKVANELKRLNFSDFGGSAEGGKGLYNFKSNHGWTAQLSLSDNEGDTYKYFFQFTKWQTRRNIPWRIDTMNMLLTSIEKMFLKLDPKTQVESSLFKTKSKTSIL